MLLPSPPERAPTGNAHVGLARRVQMAHDSSPGQYTPFAGRRAAPRCVSSSSPTWKAWPGSRTGTRSPAASRSTRRAASSTPKRSTPPSAAPGGGSDGDRGHGLPRGRRGVVVQLPHPGPARPGLRVRRPARVDGVHRRPRSRAATRRCSSACTPRPARPTASCATPSPARSGRTCGSTASRGRERHQRRAVRPLGLPGAPRHRRPGRLPRGARAPRRRPHHRRR